MMARLKIILGVVIAAITSLGAVWIRYDAKRDARRKQEIKDAEAYKLTNEAVSRSQEDSSGLDGDDVRKRLRDLAGRE